MPDQHFLLGETFIEAQGFFQELALKRLQPWLMGQPLFGDLGVHVVHGRAGLLKVGLSSLGIGHGHAPRLLRPDALDALPEQPQGGAGDSAQQEEQDHCRGQHRSPVAADEFPQPVAGRWRTGNDRLVVQVALRSLAKPLAVS